MNSLVISAIVIVIGIGTIAVQQHEISKISRRLEVEKIVTSQLTEDLHTCRTTRDALKSANEDLLKTIRTGNEEMDQARQSLETLSATILREAHNVRREREVIYREPNCLELGDMDIAAVCPDLALSLRERAAHVGAPREDRSPGTSAARAGADR